LATVGNHELLGFPSGLRHLLRSERRRANHRRGRVAGDIATDEDLVGADASAGFNLLGALGVLVRLAHTDAGPHDCELARFVDEARSALNLLR
jgi:hypothetical protein